MDMSDSYKKKTKGAKKHCCYGVCNSDSRYMDKDHMSGVFFIPFPKPKTNEIMCKKWLSACGRENFTVDNVKKWTYICSKHFVDGNGPTEKHPDPIPATYIPVQVQRFSRKRKCPTPRAAPVSKKTLFEASEGLLMLQHTHKDTQCTESTPQYTSPDWHNSPAEFPSIIELNAGGQLISTKLETLLKDPNSTLAAVFTGKTVVEKDKDGRYFIDCDGETFKHILEFLRFGVIPPADKALDVYRYATLFKLKDLKTILQKYYLVRFHSRMINVIERLDENKKVYEELKEKVLNDIGEINYSDNTLVPIVYIFNNNDSPCEKNHALMIGSQMNNLSEIRTLNLLAEKVIPMQTIYVDTVRDLSRCLAYELCELGYCKQGFFFDALRQETCRHRYNCSFTWKIEFVFLSRENFAQDKRLKRP